MTPTKNQERCETCKFFDRADERDNHGKCHLRPPSPQQPVVRVDDWCGEYRARWPDVGEVIKR